ncbi:MAG: NYN domain-containing protein [Parcubacteria group bacterium]
MIGKYVRGRVYVFIDAANLENSVKGLGWWIDYIRLYEYFDTETNLIGIRHYCPRFYSDGQEGFFTVLKRAGIKLVTKPLKIINEYGNEDASIRKANFDVEIAIDGIVLKSGYETLRKYNKRVIVVSSKKHVSRELINSCNKYIEIKRLKKYISRNM